MPVRAENSVEAAHSWQNGNWQRVAGAGIVCLFAAIWAWMGAGALPAGSMIIRIAAVFLSLTLLVLRALMRPKTTGVPVNRKLVAVAIAGEVIALWIMGAALGAWGRPDLLLPGLAIIVGLHFYPMASALGIPAYRMTATAMTIVGLISLVLAEALRTGFLGLGCALILWITIALPLRSTKV